MDTRIIIASLIIGLMNLDIYAIGQTMVSRPIVIAPVIGWVMGDITGGFLIGAIIELLYLPVIPVGVGVPPCCSIVAGVSTAIYVLIFENSGNPLSFVIILAYAIPLGVIFKKIDVFHRQLNVNIAHLIDSIVSKGNFKVLKYLYLSFFLFVFAKASIFSFIFINVGIIVVNAIIKVMPQSCWKGLAFVYALLPLIGFAVAFNVFYVKMKESKIERNNK